jgi:hypothetical protein
MQKTFQLSLKGPDTNISDSTSILVSVATTPLAMVVQKQPLPRQKEISVWLCDYVLKTLYIWSHEFHLIFIVTKYYYCFDF